MRTIGTRLLGGAMGSGFAICLATFANIAAVDRLSFQDIADLTGAKTHGENRWLAHLVDIPTGTEFQEAVDKADSPKLVMSHAMAVKTVEAVHTLEDGLVPATGKAPAVNRAMKGGRVFKPKSQGLSIAGMNSITGIDPVVTGSVNHGVSAAGNALLARAATFRRSLPAVASDKNAATALASLNLQQFEK